ncbi:MAG TPA: cupredoxin family copper-binding protein [Steroidobacteraceae bacterium]|nr:cupredoxin family copper-binding protein [Steroidobacteraceae bacterium]
MRTLIAVCMILFTATTFADTSNVVVFIKDFAFVPAVVKIKPGQTIEWINKDDEPHAVVANDKAYRSLTLDTGDKFARQYPSAGEYEYFCSLHPHMTGKIIVEPPTSTR